MTKNDPIKKADQHVLQAHQYLEAAFKEKRGALRAARGLVNGIADYIGFDFKGKYSKQRVQEFFTALDTYCDKDGIRKEFEARYDARIQRLKNDNERLAEDCKDKLASAAQRHATAKEGFQDRIDGLENKAYSLNDKLGDARKANAGLKDDAKEAHSATRTITNYVLSLYETLGLGTPENLNRAERRQLRDHLAEMQGTIVSLEAEVLDLGTKYEHMESWKRGFDGALQEGYDVKAQKDPEKTLLALESAIREAVATPYMELETVKGPMEKVREWGVRNEVFTKEASEKLHPGQILTRVFNYLTGQRSAARRNATHYKNLAELAEGRFDALDGKNEEFLDGVRKYLLTTELKGAAPEIVDQKQVLGLIQVVVKDLLESRDLYAKLQAHDAMVTQNDEKRTGLVHTLAGIAGDAQDALNGAILAEDYTIMEFLEGSANTISSSEDLAAGIRAYVQRADARQQELLAQKHALEAQDTDKAKKLADLAARDRRVVEESNRQIDGFFSEPGLPGWPNGHKDRTTDTIEGVPGMIKKTREAYDAQMDAAKDALFAQQGIIRERDETISSLDERVRQIGDLWKYEVQKRAEDQGLLARSERELDGFRQTLQTLQSDPMLTAFERAYARHCNMFLDHEDAQRVAAQTLYAACQPESKLQPEEVLRLVEVWTDYRGLGFMDQVREAVVYTLQHFKAPEKRWFDKFRASPLERLVKKIRKSPQTKDHLQVAAEVLR